MQHATVTHYTPGHKSIELSWDQVMAPDFGATAPPTVDDQHHTAFQQAVAQAAATMDAPPYNTPTTKLHKAMDLVLAGKVQAHQDGTYTVQGSTQPYACNGVCACPQGRMGKTKWCKHLVAVELWKRTQQQRAPASGHGHGTTGLGRPTAPPAPITADLAPQPAASRIPAQFLVELHGKQFVQYAGLLAMAHAKGLQSLSACFISVTSELALAEATAAFTDGRTFSECADATPTNVGSKVKAHFARMALTRAKARALRDALNISVCSVEELEG